MNYEPMDPKDALEEMRKLAEMGAYGDTEMNHIEADALLCRVLLHLGQKELVDEWYKVEKWFA
jgi:hypothetical protein